MGTSRVRNPGGDPGVAWSMGPVPVWDCRRLRMEGSPKHCSSKGQGAMGCAASLGAPDPKVSHSGRGVEEAPQARGGAEVSLVLKWGWRLP